MPALSRRLLALPVLLFVGTLLAQAAWLVSVPAFRGIDEFDHAYRAASVALGQWLPGDDVAENGRGDLVTVPRDLVAAAGPECAARPYTGPDNCRPVDDTGGSRVRIATAASRYHPAYYWVVGEASRGAHGTAALLVMRAVSALLCAAFAALAGWCVSRWARTRWPVVALLASLTPVLVYSGIVVAPNAVEVFAALSVWVALAGLAARGVTLRVERSLLVAAVPGAVVLATVRSLGLGWLGLCVLVVVGVLGVRRSLALVGRHRATVAGCVAVVGLAAVAAVGWLAAVRPNQLESHADNPGALAGSLVQLPVWVLQSVAVAPGRSDPAPGAVYLLCGSALLALVAAGLRVATRRVRTAALTVALVSLAGPFAMTLLTYRDVGVIWQGRYGLPLTVGVLVLCGLALDTARPPRESRRVAAAVAAGGAAFVAGHVLAVLHVLEQQRRVSPSVPAGLWHPPAAWLVAGLTLLAWVVLAGALLVRPRAEPAAAPSPQRAEPRPVAQERLVT